MAIITNARIFSGDPPTLIDGSVEFDESNGTITSVSRSTSIVGKKPIDARGMLLIPGAIDCHVHFRDPGATAKEDFSTGSAAALAGGVTTIADMPNTNPPTINKRGLESKLAEAKAKCRCDYLLFLGATPTNQPEVAALQTNPAVAGLKAYMGSSTGGLLVDSDSDLIGHFKSFGSGPKPIVLHAEDEALIKQNSVTLDGGAGVKDHNRIRSVAAEATAVKRALRLQGACKRSSRMHFAHITTVEGVKAVGGAREKGANVSCEVTPHHLFLSDSDLALLNNFGKVNPPLRRESEARELLEELIRADSYIDIVASDHAPHLRGEKELAFQQAPSGMPGVQTMLPLLVDCSVRGRLSMKRLVELLCINPSKLLGISGFKGVVSKGARADFVIVDPNDSWKVEGESLFSKCGWSPFEGRKLAGKVHSVYLGGEVAFEEGQVVSKPGKGKVARGESQEGPSGREQDLAN